MITLLSHLFIKNHDDVTNPAVRRAYGQLCGIVGICLNLAAVRAGSCLPGTLTGSIAITADAFNNLSDAGSSVVTLVGFQLAGQEAGLRTPLRPRADGVRLRPGGVGADPADGPGAGEVVRSRRSCTRRQWISAPLICCDPLRVSMLREAVYVPL